MFDRGNYSQQQSLQPGNQLLRADPTARLLDHLHLLRPSLEMFSHPPPSTECYGLKKKKYWVDLGEAIGEQKRFLKFRLG